MISSSRLTLRKRARKLVLESLYAWDVAQTSPEDIVKYKCSIMKKDFDKDYHRDVFYGVISDLNRIEKSLQEYTSRPLTDIGPIELALLRLSIYELQTRLDIPYKVVINEALRLAKKFGAAESYKFINGVLDKVAGQFRAMEIKQE